VSLGTEPPSVDTHSHSQVPVPLPVAAGDIQASEGAGNHPPAVQAAVAVVNAHVPHPAVHQLVEVDGVVALLLWMSGSMYG